jgi:hypothetical protein
MFQKFFPKEFRIETQRVFENLTPFTCIFAHKVDIKNIRVDHLNRWINENRPVSLPGIGPYKIREFAQTQMVNYEKETIPGDQESWRMLFQDSI